MDYGKVLKFSFAWLFKRETLKYALIMWAVSILFALAFVGAFFLAFGWLISSFLASPIYFLMSSALNSANLVAQLIPAVALFAVLAVVISIISYFVNLYISVLFFFYAFRTGELPSAQFSLQRLLKLFMLVVASDFLIFFSWVHRKAWIILLIGLLAMVFTVLSLVAQILALVTAWLFLALVAFGLFLAAALALIFFSLYLFFKKEPGPDAIIINRYLLLISPVSFALLVLAVLASFLSPLLGLLLMLLLFLLFFVYIIIIIYNSIRVQFRTPIFLSQGSSIFDSIKKSLDLTQGKALEVFAASLLAGIVGAIFFAILGTIAGLLLTWAFKPTIPENLWGLADLMKSYLAAFGASAEVQTTIDSIRQSIAQTMGSVVWELIVAPFSMLFGIFVTVGIYLNLLSGKG